MMCPSQPLLKSLIWGMHVPWYIYTMVDKSKLLVERVQTGVRMEKRILKVLKAFAEYHDMSLGDLLEGIVLHAFEGKTPFGAASLARIRDLKRFYELDLDSGASHHLVESSSHRRAGAPAGRKTRAREKKTMNAAPTTEPRIELSQANRRLISEFEQGRVPGGFHHADHIRVAFAYVSEFPMLEALAKFSAALKRFAISKGKPNLYHETITWAYLLLIGERMARAGRAQSWEEFAEEGKTCWFGRVEFWTAITPSPSLNRTWLARVLSCRIALTKKPHSNVA